MGVSALGSWEELISTAIKGKETREDVKKLGHAI